MSIHVVSRIGTALHTAGLNRPPKAVCGHLIEQGASSEAPTCTSCMAVARRRGYPIGPSGSGAGGLDDRIADLLGSEAILRLMPIDGYEIHVRVSRIETVTIVDGDRESEV